MFGIYISYLNQNIIVSTPLHRECLIYKEDISLINSFWFCDQIILEKLCRIYFCDWFPSEKISRILQFCNIMIISFARISCTNISSIKLLCTLFLSVKINLTASWSLKYPSTMDPFTLVHSKNF